MSSIFGPIFSRRFGVSLGIDLSSAYKQCNFDCLYCELAPMQAVSKQHDVVSVDTIINELSNSLERHQDIDVLTITANGEPTMYPHLDELIDRIDRLKGSSQTLILSNSALLSEERVFNALFKLDQVKLSLDAATPQTFRKIDRPAEGIEIETIIDACQQFSQQYRGKLFIEILFVKGLNDTPDEIASLNEALMGIECERIDIGTIDRPPAYPVEGLGFEQLVALSHQFDPSLPIHIVSRKHASATSSEYSDGEILSTLDKRPLTREDIDALFSVKTQARFEALVEAGEIVCVERSRVFFYLPSQNSERKRPKLLHKS